LTFAACNGSDPQHKPPVTSQKTDTGATTTTGSPGTDTDTDEGTDTGTAEPLPPVDEVFTYTAPPADVLFVIDASSSMQSHIPSMTDALAPLVDTWIARNIDFHAGVVDIDESAVEGDLIGVQGMKWAEPDTQAPGPGALLTELVDMVGDPSTVEAGRETTYKALSRTGPGMENEGFLRDDSELAIIVFTDSEDQSPNMPVTVAEFVDFLTTLRPDPTRIGFHSIVATNDYHDLTTTLSGVSWSVTNSPYGPALDAITTTVQGDNTFALSSPAVLTSITAHVDEPDGTGLDLLNSALTYDDVTQKVGLGATVPVTGATVTIHYVPKRI
jgi:hypothetical protein